MATTESRTPSTGRSPSSTPPTPALLSLDLQIQGFIERVRLASTATAGTSSLSASMTLEPPGAGAADSPASVSSSSSVTSSATLAVASALNYAQALFAQASALPRAIERQHYLKELENVSGLMAYHDPETSPVRRFLDPSRRAELADRLDAAILRALGRDPMPAIERIARQTTVVWAKLADHRFALAAEKGKEKARPKVRSLRWTG